MTDDPIHAALAARADHHERSIDLAPRDDVEPSPPRPQAHGVPTRRRRRPTAVAASAIAIAGVIGILTVGDDGNEAPVASDGGGDGGVPQETSADPGDDAQPVTDESARRFLEGFFDALDEGDFDDAAQMLGGPKMTASVQALLGPGALDQPGQILEQYCESAFCTGQTIGEIAVRGENVRGFLVTTPIPPGALGHGEPPEPGVEHGMEFRVTKVNGGLQVLDLPPRFE